MHQSLLLCIIGATKNWRNIEDYIEGNKGSCANLVDPLESNELNYCVPVCIHYLIVLPNTLLFIRSFVLYMGMPRTATCFTQE